MTVATLPKAPTEDKRWRIVEAAMRRQGFDSHALIESLHSVQQAFGFIDTHAMAYVAKALRVPLAKVYGVVTFYHFFTLKPQGKHNCIVCLGTACYIKGSGDLLRAVEEKYHIKEGETTADGELSLLVARCIGACGLAPATVVDGEVFGKPTHEMLMKRIQSKLEGTEAK
ncbi:MAG TPA: bidirectional hydrogenase complex protein HoxE [Phycisphaerae bacterium]|nr:bidirectional hydrogenase complex protein HoxE [Phycisphaerae bacterium]